VTHLDAHSDLGGDSGYVYLLTEMLSAPVAEMRNPKTGVGALGEGNVLAYSIACQWIGNLLFVVGGRADRPPDGPQQVPPRELRLLLRRDTSSRVLVEELRPPPVRGAAPRPIRAPRAIRMDLPAKLSRSSAVRLDLPDQVAELHASRSR
jgi:hypothetical protein